MKRELLIAGVCAAAGAGLALQLRPAPPPAPPVFQTDTLWLEKQRPALEHPTLGQRLTTTRTRGQTAIADAPSAPAQLAVRRYCEPVVATTSPQSDDNSDGINPRGEGVNPADSAVRDIQVPTASAVLPDFGGRRAGPRLELYGTLNNARRWQWSGNVRGRVTWQSDGDSVLVRGDRVWTRVVRGAPRCAAYGAAGGAIGALAGQDLRQAALTGAATALACAF